MQQLILEAGFEDTLDIRNFESLRPRISKSATWWFESARRLRRDARTVRRWMEKNQIANDEVELWTEDPIHFNTFFVRGLLSKARHVKFPHCFYLEDADTPNYKVRLEQRWTKSSWLKRSVYWPWLRLMSGVDFGDRCVFDRGYTFDQASIWAVNSIDVSNLISIDAFQDTYRTLPRSIQKDVEEELLPIRASRRPLVLLLLFGFGPGSREAYQKSITRIFAERSQELESCTLAVKVHPGARGGEEEQFFDWLKAKMPGRVLLLRSGLNLEFLLPELRPDYVWAGACGAMPIVRRLNIARPIALPEITSRQIEAYPTERHAYEVILRDIEVW